MDHPNYSENFTAMPGTGWKSNSDFSYSLISGPYDAAENNLDGIFPTYEDIKSCKINPDPLDGNFCEQTDPDVNEILADFNGAAAYVGIWLSLAVIFTIVGIVWCILNKCKCCRSKHRKGNDLDYLVSTNLDDDLRLGQYGSRKKKLVWKIVVGVLMGFWILGLTYSIFLSFASNESLRSSIFELPDDAKDALADGERYLDTTKRQLTYTFNTSFYQLADAITKIPPTIDTAQVKRSLQKLMDKLNTVEHNQVDVDIHDSQLSGLSHAAESLKSTLETEISPLIESLSNAWTNNQQPIQDALDNAKKQLDSNLEDLIAAMNEVNNDTLGEIRDLIEDAETDWLDITGSAIYGTFMGFNLILLLMLISIILGSIMVWVGKGSTQSTGFIFSRFSIVLMFIFGWIITCVMVSQFAIAGFFVEYACVGVRSMEQPNDEVPSGCNAGVTARNDYVIPTYSNVIQNCKQDQAAYPAFCLMTVVDASSIRNISDYFENLSTLKGESSVEQDFHHAQSALDKGLKLLQSSKQEVEGYVALKNDTDVLDIFGQLLEHWKTLNDDLISFPISTLQESKDKIIELVDGYETFVEGQLTSEIGKCGPIYNAVNAGIHTVCYKIFAPVATYWWSLQLFLFMVVAVIITELISERVF